MLLQCLAMKNKAEVMKEEVRTTIIDSGSADLPRKLELVDTLQQLGLDYHYGKEINDLLCEIHDARDEARDLGTAALRFYLLRKQGFNVSPGITNIIRISKMCAGEVFSKYMS